MAIQFTPGKPESKNFTLLKPGEYKLAVVECKPDTTKKGDDCLKVRLKHEDGTCVFDNLMFIPSAIWKFHQFVKACGQDPESGVFDEEKAIGTEVIVKVGIQKDSTGNYADRNSVESYIFEEGF